MELQSKFFDTGEIRLHYMEGPQSGAPLVLIHGSTGSWRGWSAVLPHLVQRWHVYVLELRGHGLSGRAADSQGYHISRNVADLAAFLRGVVGEPAVVFGHSWGAVVSFLSGGPAKEYLRALVLEDPPLTLRRKNNESKPYLNFFSQMLLLKKTYPAWEDLLAKIREDIPHLPPEVQEGMAEAEFQVDPVYVEMLVTDAGHILGVDFAQAARDITCPALLMQADPQHGAALKERDIQFVLKHNPSVRLARFKDVGHGIHDGKTAELLEVFDAFCAGLEK